jgi:hypothetical protein
MSISSNSTPNLKNKISRYGYETGEEMHFIEGKPPDSSQDYPYLEEEITPAPDAAQQQSENERADFLCLPASEMEKLFI